jgi:molybdopterin synthase sulfur carrier subunit
LKLRYFAWVRERIGKPEEEIEPPAGIATVADLMTWLSRRGEEYAHAFENPKVIRAAIDRDGRHHPTAARAIRRRE